MNSKKCMGRTTMAGAMLMSENDLKLDRLRREVVLGIERAVRLISEDEDVCIINSHLNELEKAHLSFEEEYNFSLKMKGNKHVRIKADI
ncbi:hypothetical protein LLL92_004776 [Vibrio parahaemolyticus]|nr:hypothetical protein [Vibrio parahaemolyticus]